MFMDDMFLKYQGFHPSDFTRAYLDEKMSAIREEAPYGSHLHATFTRQAHIFKGVVTIYSSAGKFFAVAESTRLKEVTHKLMDQLRRQLNKWKSERFQPKEVRHDSNSVA